jgi:aminopeptidase N
MLVWIGLSAALAQDPLREAFKHPGAPRVVESEGRSRLPGWDVERYGIALALDPGARVAVGRVTIDAVPLLAEPGPVVLDAEGPTVTAVTVDGDEAVWTAADGEVTIEVPAAAVQIEVEYTTNGAADDDFLGLFWGRPIWTQNEPNGARTWLPVVDDPAEKAKVSWTIVTPGDQKAVANGIFVGQSDLPDGRVAWEYELDEPIPPYLMALMVTDYEVVVDETDEVTVESWGYPDRAEPLALGVGDTGAMIGHFGDLWGPYPFPLYRNVMTPIQGGMEHPTATSFGADNLGEPGVELLNAHEVAHHWWGNDVTCASWDEIWLNEGFATYGEVLWVEETRGEEEAATYRRVLRDSYHAWKPFEGDSPLYAPTFMWGGTVYDKGALVVHQLREVVGEVAFVDGLRAYREAHHFDVATSEDLREAMEGASGQDLGWFFDQWVYRGGDPDLVVGVRSTEMLDGTWQVDVHVRQTGDAWRFPARWNLVLDDGTALPAREWVEGGDQVWSTCTGAPAADLEFDPGEDLLYASLAYDDAAFAPAELACGRTGWVGGGRACATTPSGSPLGQGGALLAAAAYLFRRSRVARASATRGSSG